jgi:hypothetical protein
LSSAFFETFSTKGESRALALKRKRRKRKLLKEEEEEEEEERSRRKEQKEEKRGGKGQNPPQTRSRAKSESREPQTTTPRGIKTQIFGRATPKPSAKPCLSNRQSKARARK